MTTLHILRSVRPAVRPVSAARPALRPFSTTWAVRHGERHDGHKKDTPGFEVEKHKKESIEQQKKGQGQWSSALASDSEEMIQADKSGFDIKDLANKAQGKK